MPRRPLVPLTALEHTVHAVHPQQVVEAQRRLLADESYVDLAETFRALADSTRAKILHLLAERSLCVCDLAQAVGVSEPAVSQHLRLLRSLRMVRGHRQGKMVYYSLEDAHVRALLRLALDHSAETAAAAAERLPS
jgi:DNA-binding transcriptional ArsR family regulator